MSLRDWMVMMTAAMQGGGAGLGPEQTLTLQTGNDTYIRDSSPTTQNGAAVTMNAGEYNAGAIVDRILIKFSFAALPDNAVINSATLKLFAVTDFSSNARTFRVYRQKRAWVDNQATWNVYTTGNSWQTAGGFGANDCEQTDIGSRAFTATETLLEFKEFALTPTTKADLDLGNGWMVKADTEIDDMYAFATFENATAERHPILEIKYQVPL